MNTLPDYIELTDDPEASVISELSHGAYSQIAVLVDEHTRELCYPMLNLPEHVCIEIASGEINKSISTCALIWDHLTDAGFDRNGLLINVGGGVIGDMGGFAAACFKRGIDFINVPTTLLAQVDASIGGKLGIDFNELKNQIGVFQLPKKVIVAPTFLGTLPERHLRSGFAEIIKHGLIYNAEHFYEVQDPSTYDSDAFLELIQQSISVKQAVVEADPKEQGMRKILNFGHTLGHAIESLYLDTPDPLLHGEAIAVGMIAEAYLSNKNGLITADQLSIIVKKIESIFPKRKLEIDKDEFVEKLRQDKKNQDKEILAALLSGIGSAKYDVPVSGDDALDAIAFYTSS